MAKNNRQISLPAAAVVAGCATLVMTACAPFSELYAYPKLIIAGNAAETYKNIITHHGLFAALLTGYLITFICDIIAAWALYILLKPANNLLSALTALFRLTFAFVAITSLINLANVFRLAFNPDFLVIFKQEQLQVQITLLLSEFRYGFHFGLIFFGIYLGLLGYLVCISKYIPRILGLLLILSGLGYLATSLQPYLFPNINLSFATYTFYGELIFMLWLLIKGWKIKEPV